MLCFRIMKPVDGTNVYQDTEAREQCKQSWQHILKIMHTIGFNADVSAQFGLMATAVLSSQSINQFIWYRDVCYNAAITD